jgi:hypothetical protein
MYIFFRKKQVKPTGPREFITRETAAYTFAVRTLDLSMYISHCCSGVIYFFFCVRKNSFIQRHACSSLQECNWYDLRSSELVKASWDVEELWSKFELRALEPLLLRLTEALTQQVECGYLMGGVSLHLPECWRHAEWISREHVSSRRRD